MAAPVGAALGLPAATAGPVVEVWKDPTCGCSKEWIAYLRNAGFAVTAHDSGNVAARARAGIAPQYGSCHTASIDGYAIEGHLPVREIARLRANLKPGDKAKFRATMVGQQPTVIQISRTEK